MIATTSAYARLSELVRESAERVGATSFVSMATLTKRVMQARDADLSHAFRVFRPVFENIQAERGYPLADQDDKVWARQEGDMLLVLTTLRHTEAVAQAGVAAAMPTAVQRLPGKGPAPARRPRSA